MLYKLVVFLHVVFVFGYLLAHGVSAAVSFALKKEKDIPTIRTLLSLSASSYPLMFGTLFGFLITGIIAGFVGSWWRFGWIWASIILLIIIAVLMSIFGSGIYNEVRKAAGIKYAIKGKWYPPEPAKNDEEILEILAKTNPVMLTIIGYGGFVVITWLMVAKPF